MLTDFSLLENQPGVMTTCLSLTFFAPTLRPCSGPALVHCTDGLTCWLPELLRYIPPLTEDQ